MTQNQETYRQVDLLPHNAETVRSYIQKMGFSKQYLYKLLRLKKEGKKDSLGFEVVVWKGQNYIVPNNKK